jgi:hypothetical protein
MFPVNRSLTPWKEKVEPVGPELTGGYWIPPTNEETWGTSG